MSPVGLAEMLASHGALGLACVVIVALAAAVVQLSKTRDADRREYTAWMVTYTERQLDSDARMTAALVAVRDAITMALATIGDRR